MKPPPSRMVDYRRLARRNLHSLLTFKFLNEYGYDKGEVVVKAIVAPSARPSAATTSARETSSRGS